MFLSERKGINIIYLGGFVYKLNNIQVNLKIYILVETRMSQINTFRKIKIP